MKTHQKSLTVLPFLLTMFIAVFAMPTHVVKVDAWGLGIEHEQPWLADSEDPIASDAKSLLTRAINAMRGHPEIPIALVFVTIAVTSGSSDVLLATPAVLAAPERLKELKQAKADTFKAMKETRDKLAAKDLSDESRTKLRTEFAGLQTKFDSIVADIEIDEQLLETEASFRGAPDPAQETTRQALDGVGRIEMGADRTTLDPTGGFKTMAEYGRAVREAFTPGGSEDKRLTLLKKQSAGIMAAPTNYHQETGGSSGEGYPVPAQHRDAVFELAFPGDDLVSAVNPEPTDSNAVDIDADETTPWGSTGVQAKWRTEASQMTATKHEQKLRTVRLNELYAFVTATDELLADSPRLQNRLTVKSAQAIRFKASAALVNGTGAGQPLGWMKSKALVTVLKEGSQAADTINEKNVLKMFARLLADGGSPFWLANRNTIPQIATMTIGDQPIWTPPGRGLVDAPGGMLLGMPIRWSEHAETLGDKGDLQLVNPIGYYATIRRGEGLKFASSIHLYFDYGIQAFRWTFRLGGEPFLSDVVTANKGDTKSHFVCIEAR